MAGADAQNHEKLTYRDLADRLGISPHAARMKAQRKQKAGLWRVIPGGRPGDRVLVEVPADELTPQANESSLGRAQERPDRGEIPAGNDTFVRDPPSEVPVTIDELETLLSRAKDVLITAHDKIISNQQELSAVRTRINELTILRVKDKDLLIMTQQELISSQQKLSQAGKQILSSRNDLIITQQKLIKALKAHAQDAAELAGAETREMGTKAELERALADIKVLKDELRFARRKRPWWRRMFR